MSPFQAGNSDHTKLFTECTMINQILLSRFFAGRFPLSKEEQLWSLMMVGTQQSTVTLGSLGPFLRTCRRSRCFDCKVHKCETWNYLPRFALLHFIQKPYVVAQKSHACEFHWTSHIITKVNAYARNFPSLSNLHLLTGHNFSLNRKNQPFLVLSGISACGLFFFFYAKTPTCFPLDANNSRAKRHSKRAKIPGKRAKMAEIPFRKTYGIKNQPRAEKNASGKKNTFGQLFCLKPFGLKLKPSRRSRNSQSIALAQKVRLCSFGGGTLVRRVFALLKAFSNRGLFRKNHRTLPWF